MIKYPKPEDCEPTYIGMCEVTFDSIYSDMDHYEIGDTFLKADSCGDILFDYVDNNFHVDREDEQGIYDVWYVFDLGGEHYEILDDSPYTILSKLQKIFEPYFVEGIDPFEEAEEAYYEHGGSLLAWR